MEIKKLRFWPILATLRPGQWVKNSLLFTAIIFNGQLFNQVLFVRCIFGFIIFCVLSSASYIFNDLIDLPYDRIHPQKKYRPLASGALNPLIAIQIAILLALGGLISSLLISYGLFALGLAFITLHVLYSSKLKKFAIVDILVIASSFIIRTFAGEVLTGYHVPIWLMLTVVFLSLFVASGKRRAELVLEGAKTRPALLSYRTQLLDFYTSTFANATLISYALFTFFTEPQSFSEPVTRFLLINFPMALGRKWLMAATIPFVIFGTMRYAQLIYEKHEGEKPEKLLTSDLPLSITAIGWGLSIILIIYVF
jgi:decaprenyl-phosphate phosphoribosyltransferase